MHPHDIEGIHLALGILGISFAVESYSSAVAVAEIKAEASKLKMPFFKYLLSGVDPMNTAVLMEDSAALVSLYLRSL